MIQQLNKRFKLEGIPDANTLLAMKLNPTVNKVRDSFVTMLVVFLTRLVGVVQEAVFSSSQRDAMNEAYDLLFNKTASFYFAKRQAEAEAAAQIARPAGSPSPARGAGDGTAAAAARAERPGANRTTGNVLADADAAFTLNLNDTTDADVDDPANADLTDNRGVEKAAFAMMDKSEMKLGLAKGSFSVCFDCTPTRPFAPSTRFTASWPLSCTVPCRMRRTASACSHSPVRSTNGHGLVHDGMVLTSRSSGPC